jgi:hypothetical protein
VLPAESLTLPDELARVDGLLDDPAFFAPFVPFFDPRIGRPSEIRMLSDAAGGAYSFYGDGPDDRVTFAGDELVTRRQSTGTS